MSTVYQFNKKVGMLFSWKSQEIRSQWVNIYYNTLKSFFEWKWTLFYGLFYKEKELINVCPKNDRGKTGAEWDVREEEDSLSQNYLWRIWFYLSNTKWGQTLYQIMFAFLIKLHFQGIQVFRNFIEKRLWNVKISCN